MRNSSTNWIIKKLDQISDLKFITLKFVKKTSMPNPVERLGYYIAPDLLKALAMLSEDTTVDRSAVDRQDLKPYSKSEKRPHFSR